MKYYTFFVCLLFPFQEIIAQTCEGAPSFKAPIQFAPYGQFSEAGYSLGASLGYGRPRSVFGSVQVGTTSLDVLDDASSLDLGANLGYQIAFGDAAELCPVIGGGITIGPNNISGTAVDHGAYSIAGGLRLGVAAGGDQFQVVPTVGFVIAYSDEYLEDDFTRIEASNTFGIAQLGVGLVISSIVSIRPNVAIPVGLNGSDPTYGVGLVFNFGPRTDQPPRSAREPDAIMSPRQVLVDEEVPPGANFVADKSTRQYFKVGCPAAAAIEPTNRLYYRTEAALQAAGFEHSPEC